MKAMIDPDAKIDVDYPFDDKDKGVVILREPKSPDSKVKIIGIPNNAIVIKGDNFGAPPYSFASTQGECKRADYIIIAERDSKRRMLFIEMKRTKDSEHDVIAQLRGTYCFFEYSKIIAKHFFGTAGFLDGFEPRYVSFSHTAAKSTTRIECKDSCNDEPEKLMKISCPNSKEYNRLVGKK